jgi:hypothetical protein
MARREWTRTEEQALTALRRGGSKLLVIARRLNRSETACRAKLSRLGVVVDTTRAPKRGKGELTRAVVRRLRAGQCVRDVSEELGVYPSVVSVIRARAGIVPAPLSDARRRSWEWRRKADPARVAELTAAGYTRAEIAAELKCSVGCVAFWRRKSKAQARTTAHGQPGSSPASSCATSAASPSVG